ncbi:hypothetical protein [Streptomyces sp. NPDC059258]|uniref:hypothetical protein n=1 Tax=unclassified Streptomyces TaxID=2593676 RepID=UPI0036A13D01
MTFEDEWQQQKADVAAQHGSSMRLNGVPSYDPGGPHMGAGPGTEDYVVFDDDLGQVGHDAFLLFDDMRGAGKHARTETGTAATSLQGDGFAMGKAMAEVNKVWERQVKTLMQACAHISNHLEYTSKANKVQDELIETDMSRVKASKINEYFK